ncbi:hypothetical protein Tco_1243930 [Tanacetum coccineum]
MEWYSLYDDQPIDVSDDEETKAFVDTDDTIPKSPPASPKTLQIRYLTNHLTDFTNSHSTLTSSVEKLEGFKLELLADLIALPGTLTNVSSYLEKFKVLDVIPDIMNKVDASLDRFTDEIPSTSKKAGTSGVPSVGQDVTQPVEGENVTRGVERPRNQSIAELFQQSQLKDAARLNNRNLVIHNKQITTPSTEPITTITVPEPITIPVIEPQVTTSIPRGPFFQTEGEHSRRANVRFRKI